MKKIALFLLVMSAIGLASCEPAIGPSQNAERDKKLTARFDRSDKNLDRAKADGADTLRTQDYTVTISRNCPEGNVVCDRVAYDGTNVKTGESLQLQGKTIHTTCADGVTPCRFMGYEFFNGDYRYVVTQDGHLQVFQDGTLILDQIGNWQQSKSSNAFLIMALNPVHWVPWSFVPEKNYYPQNGRG